MVTNDVEQTMGSVGGSGIVEIMLTNGGVWIQGYCYFAFHFFYIQIIYNDLQALWLLLFGDQKNPK